MKETTRFHRLTPDKEKNLVKILCNRVVISKFEIRNSCRGVLLIELLIVIMIIGILITGAVKAWDVTIQQTRFTQTKKEMDELCYAITGNPELYAEGRRTDFGYVGDMGIIPDSLADLIRPPENTTSWRGPYIKGKFAENPDDYIQDAWGNYYSYNKDSLVIRSYTSGNNQTPQTWIHRRIAESQNQLANNTVIGRVLDIIGNPPGANDTFIRVYIIHPYNGNYDTFPPLGQMPGTNGDYELTNVPQGNHKMFCIFNKLTISDTVEKYACIYPGIINTVDFRLTRGF